MHISRGVGYMVLASLLFTTMNVFVKAVPHIPPIEIILFRSVISLVISVSLLQYQNIKIWGNNKKLLFARGISGAISLFLFFVLIHEIPLATAYTLAKLSPFFAAFLGVYWLQEKVKKIQWLFFVISFMGVILVQGMDVRISFLHVLMGLGASFFSGLAYTIISKLKTSEHPLVIIFYFPLVMLPISLIFSTFVWVQPQGLDWFYLLMTGILTQFAQFFMTKSYQSEQINKVSIVSYMGIIFSFLYGFVFFDEKFEILEMVGIFVILAGVMSSLLVRRKKNLVNGKSI